MSCVGRVRAREALVDCGEGEVGVWFADRLCTPSGNALSLGWNAKLTQGTTACTLVRHAHLCPVCIVLLTCAHFAMHMHAETVLQANA